VAFGSNGSGTYFLFCLARRRGGVLQRLTESGTTLPKHWSTNSKRCSPIYVNCICHSGGGRGGWIPAPMRELSCNWGSAPFCDLLPRGGGWGCQDVLPSAGAFFVVPADVGKQGWEKGKTSETPLLSPPPTSPFSACEKTPPPNFEIGEDARLALAFCRCDYTPRAWTRKRPLRELCFFNVSVLLGRRQFPAL
jgi:hypothetical protein